MGKVEINDEPIINYNLKYRLCGVELKASIESEVIIELIYHINAIHPKGAIPNV